LGPYGRSGKASLTNDISRRGVAEVSTRNWSSPRQLGYRKDDEDPFS
jgi:hypothetical protein